MNTDSLENTQIMDNTVVPLNQAEELHLCPACGHANPMSALKLREYRCQQCKLELAHLDYTANGSIRGIFGWLLAVDAVIEGRYKIKSVLGKGGFGATYLVNDLRLSGKRRALKEVPKLLFDEYETSLLSKLDHPAIPDIIDHIDSEGMVYLVLKFGGSSTLGGERKRYPFNRIPQEILLPWMRQLCGVLIYLHKQTPPIIHRDLKPDNILLNEDERIMLIDFGIAKEAHPDKMTRTLGRAATMGFSPPEQVMGTGTDERADIYALGATFYALLTGQNPPAAHERVSGKELIPPSEYVPEVLPEVEEAIIQSLQVNMHHRQQTVKEFAIALGGMDWTEDSRPVRSEEDDRPTLSASQASLLSQRPSAGLKLPTSGTAASRRSSKLQPVEPQPTTGLIAGIPASAFGLGLAALVIGVGLYWLLPTGQPTTAPQPVSLPTNVPSPSTRMVESPKPTPAAPALQTAEQPVAAPTPPVVSGQPPSQQSDPVEPPLTPVPQQAVSPPPLKPLVAPVKSEGNGGSANEVLRARSKPAEPRPSHHAEAPPAKKASVPSKKKAAQSSGGDAWSKANHDLDNFLRQ